MSTELLRGLIRDVPDFPKPGIMFKDITPLLRDPRGLDASVMLLAEPFRDQGVTRVAGIESRGFIFGSCVARILGAAAEDETARQLRRAHPRRRLRSDPQTGQAAVD